MTHTETTTQGPTVEALLCYPLIGYLSKCLFYMLVEVFTFIRHHNKYRYLIVLFYKNHLFQCRKLL